MTTTSFGNNAGLVLIVLAALVPLAAAGYVDLYRDANFKTKLKRVEGVTADICHAFICAGHESPLNDVIESAKWDGLTETSDYFSDGDAQIWFYADYNCMGGYATWNVKAQSDKSLPFPNSFALNGLEGSISSFRVISTGRDAGWRLSTRFVCGLDESTTATNTTSNKRRGSNGEADNL